MGFIKRVLPAAAGALILALGVATPALATSPFTATIASFCVVSGGAQTVTVHTLAGNFVHIEVSIGGSTSNGGTQHGTGLANSNGTFTDQFTIPTTTATAGTVKIWVFANDGITVGRGAFDIQATGVCPSPGPAPVTTSFLEATQVSNSVKKTCDTGLTGNAAFSVSITVHVVGAPDLTTTVSSPAGATLTLACNGAALPLPVLPVTSVVTLHESSAPTGASAAADTHVTIAAQAPVTTIHNAKAPAATTPPVLALTGGGQSGPSGVPWPALLGLVLIAGAAARLIYRRS